MTKNIYILKLLLVTAIFLAAKNLCYSQPAKRFVIKGKIHGLKNGFMLVSYSTKKNIQDTIIIKEGKFSYSGKVFEPTLATFYLDKKAISFYLEKGKMIFDAKNDSFTKAELFGSQTNDDMEFRGVLINNRIKINTENNIQEDIPQLTFAIDTGFINSTPESYYSLRLLNFYFSDLDYKFITAAFGKFKKKYQESKMGIDLRDKLELSAKSLPGVQVNNFTFLNEKGGSVSLKSIAEQHNIIAIDLWASWCIPCRENTPFVKSLYNKFNSKGLGILSLSIDKKKESWIKAIQEDGINIWYNGIDDERKSIENLLGIISIPTIILFDKNLKIINKFNGRWKGKRDLELAVNNALSNIEAP